VAHDIEALLGVTGVARVRDLARLVDRHTVGDWVRNGRLTRLHPGVVALAERSTEWSVRALAAVLACDGLLSHVSALAAWRLAPELPQVHVSVPPGRSARLTGVQVHRATDLETAFWQAFPLTTVPRSVVDTWGQAHGRGAWPGGRETSRAAVIEGLRDRRVRPHELRAEVTRRPALPGRRELSQLVDLVEQGCHSELEVWGVLHVLRAPGMPRFVQQHPVRLGSRTVHLDAALPDLRLAVELDGAAFHGSAAARERDLRRDTALAGLGWVVLRFSYRRLTSDPDGCRREILAACAARRPLLSAR
jgi:very-short-patch-repair endonuclease